MEANKIKFQLCWSQDNYRLTDEAYPVKVVKNKSENKDHEEKEKKIPSQPVIIYYESKRSES